MDSTSSATLDLLVHDQRVTPQEAEAIVREVRSPHAGGAGEVLAAVGAVIVAATVVGLTEGLVDSDVVAAAISTATAVALGLIGVMLRRGRTETTRRVVSVVLSAAVITAGVATFQFGSALVGPWDWESGTGAGFDAWSQLMDIVTVVSLAVAASLAIGAYRLAHSPVSQLVMAGALLAMGPAGTEAAGIQRPLGSLLAAGYLLAVACGWYLAQRAGWLRERTTAHLVISTSVVAAAGMTLNAPTDVSASTVGVTLIGAGLLLLAGYFTMLRSGATLAVALLVIFVGVEVLLFALSGDPVVGVISGVVIGLGVVVVGVWLTVRAHRSATSTLTRSGAVPLQG